MKNKRIKIPAQCVRTRAEMEDLASEIVSLKLKLLHLTAAMDGKIVAARAEYAESIGETQHAIDDKMEIALAWANANPDEFKNAKSIEMTQAVIGFHTGQPQLKLLRGWTWDRVLNALESLWGINRNFSRFVRVKKEVDKAQLIAERDDLLKDFGGMGVQVVQEESFFVNPKLTETEKRETVDAAAFIA